MGGYFAGLCGGAVHCKGAFAWWVGAERRRGDGYCLASDIMVKGQQSTRNKSRSRRHNQGGVIFDIWRESAASAESVNS